MQIYQTIKNADGTFTINYKSIIKDVNGIDVQIQSESHTRSLSEIQGEIDSINQQILSGQNNLISLQNEVAAIQQLG